MDGTKIIKKFLLEPVLPSDTGSFFLSIYEEKNTFPDTPEATDNCPVKHCPTIKRSVTPVIPLKLMETHLYIRTLFLFVSKK